MSTLPLHDSVQGSRNLFVPSQSRVSSLALRGRSVFWAQCSPPSVQFCTPLTVFLTLCVSRWVHKLVVALPSLNRRVQGSRLHRTQVDRSVCSRVTRPLYAKWKRVYSLMFVLHALAWVGGRWMSPLGDSPVARALARAALMPVHRLVSSGARPEAASWPTGGEAKDQEGEVYSVSSI